METIRGFTLTPHAAARIKKRGISIKRLKGLFNGVAPHPHGRHWVFDNGYYRMVVSLQDQVIITAYIHDRRKK